MRKNTGRKKGIEAPRKQRSAEPLPDLRMNDKDSSLTCSIRLNIGKQDFRAQIRRINATTKGCGQA
jgi:hypothetical protein